MHRFFVDKSSIVDNLVQLSADDSKHVCRVLRLCVGDEITVCDGMGFDYLATITSVADFVTVELSSQIPSRTESEYRITLVQCLPKTGKMEVIIQKCVELGVYEIVPCISARCVSLPDEKSFTNKLVRYNKVSYEAAKQSQRGIIPAVKPLIQLTELRPSDFDVVLLPYEEERSVTLKAATSSILKDNSVKRIAVIIGPEGGFEPQEVQMLATKQCVPLTLGTRILRTETAGMATLAVLMCMLEG